MWEKEDYFSRDRSFELKRQITDTIFETGRESRRRIRKENRKTNKFKK